MIEHFQIDAQLADILREAGCSALLRDLIRRADLHRHGVQYLLVWNQSGADQFPFLQGQMNLAAGKVDQPAIFAVPK